MMLDLPQQRPRGEAPSLDEVKEEIRVVGGS